MYCNCFTCISENERESLPGLSDFASGVEKSPTKLANIMLGERHGPDLIGQGWISDRVGELSSISILRCEHLSALGHLTPIQHYGN